jgi:hypothetical protein
MLVMQKAPLDLRASSASDVPLTGAERSREAKVIRSNQERYLPFIWAYLRDFCASSCSIG